MNYRDFATYQIGLYQAQAYRNLQEIFRTALEPFALTIPEWSVMGIVYDHKQIGLSQLTEIMQSKASHPTVIVETLRQRGLLVRQTDDYDRRVKTVQLTDLGRQIVEQAEPEVRRSISAALKDMDRTDLQGYFQALVTLSKLD